jgi:hypothetical protein
MKTLSIQFGLLTTLLLLATSAGAATITLDDCDSMGCAGSTVGLTVVDGGAGTWDVTLTLDSTGYFGAEDGVVQAGFKAISGASAVTLDSYSDGTWSTAKFAGISSNSLCAGPGEPDFGCTSGYANIETDKVYTWNFTVTGGTLLDTSDWAIKFQYCDQSETSCKGHILSAHEPGNPVPEPSAALVFAVGLLVARPLLRHRR